MRESEIRELVERQRAYYRSGETLSIPFRRARLKALSEAIVANEERICAALQSDLGKGGFEAYMCEIGMVRSELHFMLRHLGKFAKPKRVRTPLAQFPAKSYRYPLPYGNTLIMSPWNYPFLLTLGPLVDAIAAGNTAIVKPSAYSPATSSLLAELLGETFSPEYIAVVTGGREENAALLSQRFDLIFFTGSQTVGKEVLRRAAEHLTPVVLELGGKSPTIVDETADIPLAARRIVFGKLLNAGQTCVAPDYILCAESVKERLVSELKREIVRQYGEKPLENGSYGRIVSRKHFDRLLSLIDAEKVVFGGESDPDALRIAPTLLDGVTEGDAVMGEEIFGPLLPILTFSDFDKTVDGLKEKAKPLALYLFSRDPRRIRRVCRELSYGGGCVNDVIIHLASDRLGFGGVGESGMGCYHGYDGFRTFSHTKSVVHKSNLIDLPLRYQPYGKGLRERLVRFFLK